jgi:hypothetical protein
MVCLVDAMAADMSKECTAYILKGQVNPEKALQQQHSVIPSQKTDISIMLLQKPQNLQNSNLFSQRKLRDSSHFKKEDTNNMKSTHFWK